MSVQALTDAYEALAAVLHDIRTRTEPGLSYETLEKVVKATNAAAQLQRELALRTCGFTGGACVRRGCAVRRQCDAMANIAGPGDADPIDTKAGTSIDPRAPWRLGGAGHG